MKFCIFPYRSSISGNITVIIIFSIIESPNVIIYDSSKKYIYFIIGIMSLNIMIGSPSHIDTYDIILGVVSISYKRMITTM